MAPLPGRVLEYNGFIYDMTSCEESTSDMHDYQLERLNTRSFEQLVQALTLEVLGRQVSIFGDGPDGGREAAFHGPLNYPQGGKAWDGYGIVQAKFRQNPSERAQKNADWALSELEAEFKKLAPRAAQLENAKFKLRNRVCPEYYVFCTNLSLSPALNAGGKDRAQDFLEACKKTHGLIDYAIWDGDQIRRMLDAQDSIRTSFLPFILPGDVLALVMENLQIKRVDFSKTMLRHLQLELLDDQFAKLSQGGYTNSNNISLSNVFVDLPVEMSAAERQEFAIINKAESRSTFLEKIFSEAAKVQRPSLQTTKKDQASPKKQSPVDGRIVVIGGPGQGKTTAGVFACQIMRASLLREAKGNYDQAVEIALNDVISQSASLPTISTLRYPLRVDLKRLAEALAPTAGTFINTLLQFLTFQISKRTGTQLEIEDFRLWLRNYPWLLVLDGLDEVPASSNRTLMMDAINDFIRVEAYQEDADLMVVATTRPQGYSDEFDPNNYTHLRLLALSSPEALQYGARLAEARHLGATTRIESIKQTLTVAISNPATARLMESPLQVTIMLSLIELGGHPPEQRWQLFQQYYDTIFKREKERNTSFSITLRDYEADIHWIHHRAGWLLQQRNAESGSTAARLTHDEFDDLVNQRLISKGHADGEELSALVAQIHEAATDRLVLLVGNTAQEIGFEIRSLQEFMAAEHAFDGDDAKVLSTLRLIAPHAYWQNVFLFMAGRIFFKKEILVDSLITICDHLNEPLNDAGYAKTFAGSWLALAMLADDTCRKQPANIRRLARISAKLMDQPMGDDRKSFVQQFNREAREVLQEELTSKVKSENFLYGAWTVCLDLARENNAWAKDLMEKFFPWKSNNIDSFLLHFLKTTPDVGDFFWNQLAKNLRHTGLGVTNQIISSERFKDFGKHFDAKVGEAILSIFDTFTISLIDDNGSPSHNKYKSVFEINRYAHLRMQDEEFSDAHPDWQVFSLASKFSENTNLTNLHTQAKALLKINPLPLAFHFFPWQFNVCLNSASAGLDVETILKSVLNGSIGDMSDWNEWSRSEEFYLSNFKSSPSLISVSSHELGNAFCNAGWTHNRATLDEELNFINHIRKILSILNPDREISKSLIFLSCFGLNGVAQEITDFHEPQIYQFIAAINEKKHKIGREIVASVLISRIAPSSKLNLLKSIGGSTLNNYWLSGNDKSNESIGNGWINLYDYAIGINEEMSILPALATMPPMACMSNVAPDVLHRAMRGSPELQAAAALIRLGSVKWKIDETDSVARDFLAISESEPNWIADFLGFIDTSGSHGAHLELLFINLPNIASPLQQKRFKLTWSRALAKIVDRRQAPTTLPDPSQRTKNKI